jgi:hypothetical protein
MTSTNSNSKSSISTSNQNENENENDNVQSFTVGVLGSRIGGLAQAIARALRIDKKPL